MADKVVALDVYIDSKTRQLAREAYAARLAHRKTQERLAHAMRAFADALERFGIHPDDITIGEINGTAVVPARHPCLWCKRAADKRKEGEV